MNSILANTIEELLARAREAHEAIGADDATALRRALEAGAALNEAKAQVPRGDWTPKLEATGIPPSTARLYMQLARNRERILAAGCKSIREARRLVTGTKPPRPKRSAGGRGRPPSDRYEEGYADGYRAGRADGFARGKAEVPASNGPAPLPLDRKDLRWVIKLAHPDHHDGDLRATRVTQWLNDLLAEARKGAA